MIIKIIKIIKMLLLLIIFIIIVSNMIVIVKIIKLTLKKHVPSLHFSCKILMVRTLFDKLI